MDCPSDLQWLDETGGFVVAFEGLEEVPTAAVTDLRSILPAVVDRWRAQSIPLVALSPGAPGLCLQADGNQRLAAAAEVAWAQPGTGPVEIVDHRS